jgi:hypothetical protein
LPQARGRMRLCDQTRADVGIAIRVTVIAVRREHGLASFDVGRRDRTLVFGRGFAAAARFTPAWLGFAASATSEPRCAACHAQPYQSCSNQAAECHGFPPKLPTRDERLRHKNHEFPANAKVCVLSSSTNERGESTDGRRISRGRRHSRALGFRSTSHAVGPAHAGSSGRGVSGSARAETLDPA